MSRKAELKPLGMLPGSCIASRNTSILLSVLSGPFQGVIFVVNNNSSGTHMLVVCISGHA